MRGIAVVAYLFDLEMVGSSILPPATKCIIMDNSIQLCEHISNISNNRCIISFSMGKDSIASYLQCRDFFNEIDFVFLYMIPDLDFQNISLDYYENKFGKKIIRMPNPSLYKQINANMYQPPNRIDTIWDMDLYEAEYDEIFKASKIDLKIDENTYVGVGNRMSDSIMRRTSIKRWGAYNQKRKQFFPVFDWTNNDVRNSIVKNNIKLPIDYKIWGRSFDGFDYRFLKPLKDNFPKDYEKVLEFFPLAKLELIRYEKFKR